MTLDGSTLTHSIHHHYMSYASQRWAIPARLFLVTARTVDSKVPLCLSGSEEGYKRYLFKLLGYQSVHSGSIEIVNQFAPLWRKLAS